MVAPTAYDVTILINDVDVSSYVPYESMSFEDYARQVSSFTMTVENPSGVTPTRNHTVVITANSLTGTPIIFNGIISEVTTKRHGITTHYELECSDTKVYLQKSVLDYGEYTGLDSDILSSLLSNAYPDLSSYFDFATDVNSFADDLNFAVPDGSSLLDSLNDFGDLTGGDWSFEDVAAGLTSPATITFDGGDPDYTTDLTDSNATVTTGGNPGNCLKATYLLRTAPKGRMWITFDAGQSVTWTNLTWDLYGGSGDSYNTSVYLDGVSSAGSISTSETGAWKANTSTLHDRTSYFPLVGQTLGLRIQNNSGSTSNGDWRVDNIVATFTGGGSGTNQKQLQWNDTAPAADFNFDIQSGTEYASDIDFTVGGFDDFNSVTVIGGYEEVAIDLIFDNDGVLKHLDLPYPVSSLVVYTNGGTDTTPSWGTALALGTWGTDTLSSAGGTKDVLYDDSYHWLNFDTAPPNLVKSWRITGTVKRPIRVRVENVADGDPTFAKSYQDETITSVDEAIAIGQAQLEQQNAIKRITFKTHNPGLKPGQSINIADTARGLDETLVIQRISTKWLGSSGHAEFDVECGDEESSSLDAILANADKRTREGGSNTAPSTQTAVLLTDDSGVLMTDNNAQQLYYIA